MISTKYFFILLTFGELSAEIYDNLIFPKLPNYVENSKSELCNIQSSYYRASLENYTFWAYEMLDASAKYTHGLLRGNIQELGDYYQCLSAEAPFQTQYCLVKVTANVPPPNPKRDPYSLSYSPYESAYNRIYKTQDVSQLSRDAVEIALCIPASCSPKNLEDFLSHYVEESITPPNVKYKIDVQSDYCQKQNSEKTFDQVDVSFCVLVLLIFALVVYCSFLDYIRSDGKSSTLRPFYRSLSAKRNFEELIRNPRGDSPFAVLNGMRTFSICVIIVMHRVIWSSIIHLKDFDYIEKEYRSPYSAFLFRTDLFVDSFFLFGGTLMAYGLLNMKAFNPFFVILMRYLRLTPAYALVIFYNSSLIYYIGSGPLWHPLINFEVENCRKNWWTNLLYINNYLNKFNICIPTSWYLPCDFHFFIIGIIIIQAIKKHRKLGLVLLSCTLVISTIIPFVITMVYKYGAILKLYRSEMFHETDSVYFYDVYIASHIRATPYIVGILTGYIYHRLKTNPMKLSRTTSYSLAFTSIAVTGLSMFSGSVFLDPYHKYNALESAAFAGFNRLPWSFGTAGLMIALSFGPNTFLKKALSLNVWSGFARLCYSAYLLHIMFDLKSFASVSTSSSANYFNVVQLAISDLVMTFMLSLLLYLGVEAPVLNLSKMLLKPIKEEVKKEQFLEDLPKNVWLRDRDEMIKVEIE